MKLKNYSLVSFLLILSLVPALALLSSCNNNEPDPIKPTYTIISETDAGAYTSIVVKYASSSANMKQVQMVSGVVTIPKGDISGIIIDNHATITSNAEAPSEMGNTTFGAIAGVSYCIVATDYIGYGRTVNELHPYLYQKQCAENAIDLAFVALDILKDRGLYSEEMKLFNVGYSQGAAVALAVHREMENNTVLAAQLGFTASWCGDGPYDVVATVGDYLSHPDNVTYPLGLPMLVQGFIAGAPEGLKGDLKFADFFTEKMNKAGIADWIMSRAYKNDDVNAKMRAVVEGRDLTVNDVFCPEMATLGGTLMHKYLTFAQLNDLCHGWKVEKFPLMLVHMQCDDVVPVFNTLNAVEGLGLKPDNYYIDTHSKMGHAAFGKEFYIYAATQIIAMTNNL